jgi:hypothetical protein
MQGAEHSNAIEQRVLEMAPEHAVLYLPFVVALVEHGVLENAQRIQISCHCESVLPWSTNGSFCCQCGVFPLPSLSLDSCHEFQRAEMNK